MPMSSTRNFASVLETVNVQTDCGLRLQLWRGLWFSCAPRPAFLRSRAKTTPLLFGLDADPSGRVSSNIHASHGSRSTERRKTARSIPSGNPNRSTIHNQRTGLQQAFHKAGFDPTTPHTQSRNSQIDFQPAYSCSISAHARSHPCQPGAGSLWRSRSNNFSRPSI